MITIVLLPGRYSVCRLAPDAEIPVWAKEGDFSSATRTADELSLVCGEEYIPAGIRRESGWRVLRLAGTFAFDQIGVLLGVLAPLARCGVSVFALSTFDTDYVLVKEDALVSACEALEASGNKVLSG